MNNTKTIVTRDARLIWRALNGVFAIYKPPKTDVSSVKAVVAENIVQGS